MIVRVQTERLNNSVLSVTDICAYNTLSSFVNSVGTRDDELFIASYITQFFFFIPCLCNE